VIAEYLHRIGWLTNSSLSLAEQVQKAASAKQSPQVLAQRKPGENSTGTTPPPQSISPLPAPAARRNRSHVAINALMMSYGNVMTGVQGAKP